MAVSQQQKEIITATVPILETGGDKLTSHFYARMMEQDPEVRKFFNQTHQKDGTQAHALAKAVLLYAKNIDHLEALGAIAPTIIEKHVALNIKPEHYPIVGRNLIASMVEVLGPDVATSAVTEAWTAAYTQLADILIGAESAEYEKLASAQGGWSDFREFAVVKKEKAADNIVSLWLEPANGEQSVLKSLPGQYITLKAVIDGTEHRRNYSVSSGPSSKGYRITVKNIGTVSKYLNGLEVGDKLELRPPVGHFLVNESDIKEQRPLVFIAGGIGITPLAAMLNSGVAGKLLYYAHSDKERALLQELTSLSHVEYHEVTSTRPSTEEIKQYVTPATSVYFVGPRGFMVSLKSILSEIGVPNDQIHYELFGSGETLD